MVSLTDMQVMLDENTMKVKEGMCIQPAVIKRGFVDTSAGLVLTQPDVMRLVEAREKAERIKYRASVAKAVAKESALRNPARLPYRQACPVDGVTSQSCSCTPDCLSSSRNTDERNLCT
jgi:hypothetical protein